MKPSYLVAIAMLFVSLFVVSEVSAQNRNNQRNRNNNQQDDAPLPDDKRLLALHRNFVKDAEKLAAEYERDKDFDKAKAVYSEILKLVPQYSAARSKLDEIGQREQTAKRKVLTINADRQWQDSGITVIQGKPITIAAEGRWTVVFRAEAGPEGIEIPEEFKDLNLGSLVGLIDDGNQADQKVFAIGRQTSFLAPKTGKLMLRMWDGDAKDNDGVVNVQIQGTFEE